MDLDVGMSMDSVYDGCVHNWGMDDGMDNSGLDDGDGMHTVHYGGGVDDMRGFDDGDGVDGLHNGHCMDAVNDGVGVHQWGRVGYHGTMGHHGGVAHQGGDEAWGAVGIGEDGNVYELKLLITIVNIQSLLHICDQKHSVYEVV